MGGKGSGWVGQEVRIRCGGGLTIGGWPASSGGHTALAQGKGMGLRIRDRARRAATLAAPLSPPQACCPWPSETSGSGCRGTPGQSRPCPAAGRCCKPGSLTPGPAAGGGGQAVLGQPAVDGGAGQCRRRNNPVMRTKLASRPHCVTVHCPPLHRPLLTFAGCCNSSSFVSPPISLLLRVRTGNKRQFALEGTGINTADQSTTD